jgi:hypothetical protein
MSGKRKKLRDKKAENARKYYEKHKEEIKQKYEDNKEVIKEKRKPWQDQHREELNAYGKIYYKRNREEIIKDQIERNKQNPNFKANVHRYQQRPEIKKRDAAANKRGARKSYVKKRLAEGHEVPRVLKIYSDHIRLQNDTDFRDISVENKKEMLDAVSAFLNSGGNRIYPETEILEPSKQ